ncbi:hypothetical protein TcWFU_001294 [Taenia crassiceps]|uniref:Uncharacterized protein n=1 Tax=Taenia crassiceps TaxID=6207 RepID=A0ABR4QFS3_9CEST
MADLRELSANAEVFEVLYEISKELSTGLSQEELRASLQLIENGADPTALALLAPTREHARRQVIRERWNPQPPPVKTLVLRNPTVPNPVHPVTRSGRANLSNGADKDDDASQARTANFARAQAPYRSTSRQHKSGWQGPTPPLPNMLGTLDPPPFILNRKSTFMRTIFARHTPNKVKCILTARKVDY